MTALPEIDTLMIRRSDGCDGSRGLRSARVGGEPPKPSHPSLGPTAVDPIRVADILSTGECTAQCLLGQESRACGCRCGGYWHGCLAGAEVSAAWRQRPSGWSVGDYALETFDTRAIDRACPLAQNVRQFNILYNRARRELRPFAAVLFRRRDSDLTVDAETAGYGTRMTDVASDLWRSLALELIRTGRMRASSGGHALIHAYGIKSVNDAVGLGMIALQLVQGIHDGAAECIAAIREIHS